jgi:hypothetical protein
VPLVNAALLERAINAASRAIDRHCGRRFWRDASVTTRTYVPTHPTLLLVDDISTRTGLVVSVGSDGATFPTALPSTSFLLEPRNADVVAGADTADAFAFTEIRRLGGMWAIGRDLPTVQVVARFGWSTVPAEVAEATIIKAAALFKRKDAPFGVAGFGEFGTVRVTRADADVLDLLAPFELAPGFA